MQNGIHTICLSARNTEGMRNEQENFLELEGLFAPQQVREELLNNFAARLGTKNVTTIIFHESYLPERSYSYQPLRSKQKSGVIPLLADRPTKLLDTPQPVTALAMI